MLSHLAVAALGAAAAAVASADVPSLTSADFESTIAGSLTLVKFFAPWCGHCKTMAEPYKEAAAALAGKAVLAEVDATVEKDLASKYNVAGFPTLKLFKDGEEVSDYKGGRDKDAFVQYIERAMLPSVTELPDAAAVDKFVKDNEGKTLYIATDLDKIASAYTKQSMALRDNLPDGVAFASVKTSKHLDGVKGDTVVAEKDSVFVITDDGEKDVYIGSNGEEMDKFVKAASVPLLGELSRGNAQVYTELGLPILLFFQDPEKKNDAVEKDLKTLAKKHRSNGKIAFAWINNVELKSFADHLGVGDAETPLVIYEFDGDTKFVFEPEYDAKKLDEWVDQFVAGELVAARKSAAVPDAAKAGEVTVVVGDTWEGIVEDKSKFVLMEQYAPWCGHCKKLGPVLDKVAKALEGVDDILISKMDATENDAPKGHKAKGFPTMTFCKKETNEYIEYGGGRDFDDFIKFFKENTDAKLDNITEPADEKVVEEKKKEDEEPKEEL